MPLPLKTEMFVLHKIEGINGYYKEILKVNGQENDKVFCYEGRLAKVIEVPELSVRTKLSFRKEKFG